MYRNFLLFVVSITAITLSAQTVSLSGKVVNKNGNPIAGAILTVVNKQVSDTTDANGLYSFPGVAAIHPMNILRANEPVSLCNGILSIMLTRPAPVKIEFFTTKGNLLDRVDNSSMVAGKFSFDLTARHFAVTMMVIRVSIGNDVSLVRYVPLRDNNQYSASSSALPIKAAQFTTTQVAIDSLRVAANSYLRKTASFSTYKDTVNFTLDTQPLAKFSFFVTSLKAIRELSKNQNGFGGDLRFGKTGAGAGLLGADSICSCIAERSMPGSKIKQWRAFLSVTSGPNGKPINAIDRIGQGPWYDRRGRVFALSANDLVVDRPLNIDAAIKEDLPNEDGLPNHQPDLNLPAVDNHLTITGSDSTGRLYVYSTDTNSTCDDWTTASATAKSKPRCGLSWTRKGFPMAPEMGGGGFMTNMKNWISMWDLPGCVAGVDSTEMSGPGDPKSKSIGAGGGYGGFYCFGLNP